jgi:hypothetical protein
LEILEERPLSEEEKEVFPVLFNTDEKYLPKYPIKAKYCGKDISPGDAFNMLSGNLVYDFNKRRLSGLKDKTFETRYNNSQNIRMNAQEQKNLDALKIKYDAIIEQAYLFKSPEISQTAQETKTENTQVSQLRGLLEKAVQTGSAPFQKEVKAGKDEIAYNGKTEFMFTGSNALSAALHKESIGSTDPRYYSENEIKDTLNLKDNAVPLVVSFRSLNKSTSVYEEKKLQFYNAAEIDGLPPYQKPAISIHAKEIVSSQVKEKPEYQMQEDITNWTLALKTGRCFAPAKTNFTNDDYLQSVKKMTDKQIVNMCYYAAKRADEICLAQKNEQRNGNENVRENKNTFSRSA